MAIQSNSYLAQNGKRFAWSLIQPFAVYGYKNQLVNDSGKSLIEIYDVDTEQMVSRYYLATILADKGKGYGICLDGGVPAWTIDANTWQAMLADIVKA